MAFLFTIISLILQLIQDFLLPETFTGRPTLLRILSKFSTGAESAIPSWYSSATLLVAALLLAVTALAVRTRKAPFSRHWAGLVAIFIVLSAEETVGFHELLNRVLTEIFQPQGLLYFPWVLPALALVVLFGLAYIPFLLALPARTGWLFVVAAAIYLGGALGIEVVSGLYMEVRTAARAAPVRARGR